MSKVILEAISLEELKSQFEAILDRKLSLLFQPKPDQVYLTRSEVCKLLRISTSTLHRYVNNGILIPCRIGKKVFFTRVSIDDVLQSRKNKTIKII